MAELWPFFDAHHNRELQKIAHFVTGFCLMLGHFALPEVDFGMNPVTILVDHLIGNKIPYILTVITSF